MGEETHGAILTKCRVWGDMVDVITYAIFGDCRLRGVGVVRGVSLPSPFNNMIMRCLENVPLMLVLCVFIYHVVVNVITIVHIS